MTNEKKQEFTLRITQANPSMLVVILYELFFSYIKEAEDAITKRDIPGFNDSLDHAQAALTQLIGSLNFEQDPASAISQVYFYVSARMGRARGSRRTEYLKDPVRLMRSLYEVYKKDSASDDRPPVMDNSQKVYAGLTYGKGELNESMDEGAGNRGFFV